MMRSMLSSLLALVSTAAVAQQDPVAATTDAMRCPDPFRMQVVRSLDFGRVVVAPYGPGSVTVTPDGLAFALGSAHVGTPPAPAEIVFCGTPGDRFEVTFHFEEGGAGRARIAPGSVETAARGARLERRATGRWEGELQSNRVVLTVGARLDVPPGGRGALRPVPIGVEIRRVD